MKDRDVNQMIDMEMTDRRQTRQIDVYIRTYIHTPIHDDNRQLIDDRQMGRQVDGWICRRRRIDDRQQLDVDMF